MLKAAIFDDEYIVLKGLKETIDWLKYGIELVGTAEDGHSALNLFRTYRPDIIMTDIRMPGMDGLQLIELIKTEAPETICIVFSGFNEYDYVKKAIKLGVVDYLEKPVTIAKIEEAVQKTMVRVNQKVEISTLKSKWEENQQELLEKATLDLLQRGSEAEEKWRQTFGADAERIGGVTVIAYSSHCSLQEHASNIVIPLRGNMDYLQVVIHLQPIESLPSWEQLLSCSETSSVTVGLGQTYSYISDVPKSYQEAIKALNFGQYLGRKGWIHFNEIGMNSAVSVDLSEQEEAVLYYMRRRDNDGLFKQLKIFIQHLETEKLDREVAEREILKLIYLGLEAAEENGSSIPQTKQSDYVPHIELRSLRSREEILQWLIVQMEMIMSGAFQTGQTLKHAAVEKALRYMREQYDHDLSLQEVSEYVSMNAAYFSLLFKEEMGETYIKYLTRYRMEQAKRMLREGEKVLDVSKKIGYHSYRHFSQLFKKYMGILPGEFKK